MKTEAQVTFQRFSDTVSRIKSDVFGDDQVDMICTLSKELDEICSLSEPVVLWVDSKRIVRVPEGTSCKCVQMQYNNSTSKEFPPLHHFWVYCCSHIESYAASTASTLLWLQSTGQPGCIVVYGTGDQKQKAKIDAALHKLITTQATLSFVEQPELVKSILPDQGDWEAFANDTAKRFLVSFLSANSETVERLLSKIINNSSSLDGIHHILRSSSDKFDSGKDAFTISRVNTIRSLYEEQPDFNWLEALTALAPELEQLIPPVVEMPTDNDSRNCDDEAEPTEHATPNSTTRTITQDNFEENDKRMIGLLNGEVKRAITESLGVVSIQHITMDDIRLVEQDSVATSARKRIAEFLNKPLAPLDLSNVQGPEWPLNHVFISEFIDKALDLNPPPKSIILKLASIVSKLPLTGRGPFVAAFVGVKFLLDKWGVQIYKNVIGDFDTTLKDFEGEYKCWLDTLVSQLNECLPTFREFGDELESYEKTCIALNKFKYTEL